LQWKTKTSAVNKHTNLVDQESIKEREREREKTLGGIHKSLLSSLVSTICQGYPLLIHEDRNSDSGEIKNTLFT
jgi:hypothetical protein